MLLCLFIPSWDKGDGPSQLIFKDGRRLGRPEAIVAGVRVGVGRPFDGLITLPEVSAKGLRFKLAGRGRGTGFVSVAAMGTAVGIGLGSGTAKVSGRTSMACSSSPLVFSSSSSSSSSTKVWSWSLEEIDPMYLPTESRLPARVFKPPLNPAPVPAGYDGLVAIKIEFNYINT
jgi:hypothetical protein